MTRRLNQVQQISSGPFVIALALLLLNDFVFKPAYNNWVTGKLSDFCGLFVFAYFWSAVFPSRRKSIHILTAIVFVFWKSSYADEFIQVFSRNLYAISRVVDATDLMALCVLPVSFYYKPSPKSQLKINPLPLALVAFFAFCATSVPEPSQQFDLPQYLLFKKKIDPSALRYPNDYRFFDLDSMLVVDIRTIRQDTWPPVKDDFQKSKISQAVDLLFIREIEGDDTMSLDSFSERRDALMVKGMVKFSLDLDTVVEKLNFNNSRLDGRFERFDPQGHLLIIGAYNNGIEDSTWEFHNRDGTLLTRKQFKHGELTKVISYQNGKIGSEDTVMTRDQRVTQKVIHVVIIAILCIVLVVQLVRNHRQTKREDAIKVKIFPLIADILLLPLTCLVLAKSISFVLPDSYKSYFLEIFVELTCVYLVGAPLLLMVLRLVKLPSWMDVILYIVLMTLSILLVEESIHLQRLIY